MIMITRSVEEKSCDTYKEARKEGSRMRIVCYGDSNTYGWDPRFFSGNRYERPWPEIMAEMTGHAVMNCGEPGRMVPYREEQFDLFRLHAVRFEPELLVIMLGTNDLFYSIETTAGAIAGRMRNMIQYAVREQLAQKILILSCPETTAPEESYLPVLEELSERYQKIAEEERIHFADPFHWDIPMAYDGVHFAEEGHRAFAENISKILSAGEV